MAALTYFQATGPKVFVGQVLTHRFPGFTATYEVTRVDYSEAGTEDIAIKCLTCVADPIGEPYKIEVMDRATGRWLKIAECGSKEAGLAYLKATGRLGLVSENR